MRLQWCMVLAEGNILSLEQEKTMQQKPDRNNKQAKFNSCAPFTNYISEINNTQVDNANTSWCCYADL